MKYMLLLYWSPSEMPAYTPEEYQAVSQIWDGFKTEARAAGVWVADNEGLAPVTEAKTVRIRDGKTLTADGPFAETHEQLGGYCMLDCKDIDEACAWAAKIPTALYGSIEVRPLYIYSQTQDDAVAKA